QGHRRPRGVPARRLPLLAREDPPRLEQRGRRAAPRLLRPLWPRRSAAGAVVPRRDRAAPRLACYRKDRGRGGQREAEREVPRGPGPGGPVVWQRPRLEAPGKPPLLLRDSAQFGPAFEVDYPSVFADSDKYLAAAVEAANDKTLTADDLAKKHGIDAAFLKRW